MNRFDNLSICRIDKLTTIIDLKSTKSRSIIIRHIKLFFTILNKSLIFRGFWAQYLFRNIYEIIITYPFFSNQQAVLWRNKRKK